MRTHWLLFFHCAKVRFWIACDYFDCVCLYGRRVSGLKSIEITNPTIKIIRSQSQSSVPQINLKHQPKTHTRNKNKSFLIALNFFFLFFCSPFATDFFPWNSDKIKTWLKVFFSNSILFPHRFFRLYNGLVSAAFNSLCMWWFFHAFKC